MIEANDQLLLKKNIVDKPGRFSHSDPADLEKESNNDLCCIACHNLVTSSDNLIVINGSTQHQFTNPAAITFNIGCFSSVDNVYPQGNRTPQDTWFPGYYWQIVKCRTCSIQLGWQFFGTDSFFGLILPRLCPCPD